MSSRIRGLIPLVIMSVVAAVALAVGLLVLRDDLVQARRALSYVEGRVLETETALLST